MRLYTITFILLALGMGAGAAEARVLDGVTFAEGDGVLYAPVRELGEALGLTVGYENDQPTLNGEPVENTRTILDGTRIMPVRELTEWGATVTWNGDEQKAGITKGDASVEVFRGPKRTVIDKTSQTLSAYQGQRLVMRSRISSGKEGHATPDGSFTAGPYKARMHRSRLYHNAAMPYSVQIEGNIFVHGYASVPDRPASHGCIRLPLDGRNSAKWFYDWVSIGSPVKIEGQWPNA